MSCCKESNHHKNPLTISFFTQVMNLSSRTLSISPGSSYA